MPSQSDFTPLTNDENADNLARCLPYGDLFAAAVRDNSVLRRVLLGLSKEQGRIQQALFALATKFIPNSTDSFIEGWEQALGIPDDCFIIENQSLATRRRNILIKSFYMKLNTDNDYFRLAAILDLTIRIIPYNANINPFVWEIIIDGSPSAGFPYTFPLTFGAGDGDDVLFQCIVQKQKPAHTQVVFTYSN